MLAGFREPLEGRGVALPADTVVMALCGIAAWNVVWVMASRATQPALATLKALGAPQPVSRAHDLEFVVMALAGSFVKMQSEVPQRLTRLVGEGTALETLDLIGESKAGCLE